MTAPSNLITTWWTVTSDRPDCVHVWWYATEADAKCRQKRENTKGYVAHTADTHLPVYSSIGRRETT